MNVGVASAILASVVCLTVAIAILFRRPRRPLYGYFSAFTFTLFLWHAASFASRIATLSQIQTIAALLIPPTALLFFRELLRYRRRSIGRIITASFVISALLLLLSLSPWGGGILSRALTLGFVVAAMLVISRMLLLNIRNARSDADRKRLRYVLFGGIIALVLALGELVPAPSLPAALGHVAVTFYVYFLYQSVVARRLIDLVELLGKAAVLGVLALVLASVYALLVLWVGVHQQGLWLFNTLVASFVILILYDQVRPWVENTTAKLLFREHYELRQAIRPLLRSLRSVIGIEDMRDRVLDTVHGPGRAKQVAMYIVSDEGELAFDLAGYRGIEPPHVLSLSQHPSLLQELRRDRRPVLLEHLQHRYQELPGPIAGGDPKSQRELERTGEAIELMNGLQANVVIPMLVEERILGLIVLGTEHNAPYSTDELTALLTLCEACAIVIENSHELQIRRERDRLVAVGEMAAGLAHEIRNPLGAIKGAVQCLDPGEMSDESHEFLDVIIEEVDRLNSVVEQFLEYARPYRGNPVAIDVNDVVAATMRLLGRDAVPGNVQVDQQLAQDLPRVSIDPEQLKQVLINLVLNAIQAMPTGGELRLRTRLVRDQTGEFDITDLDALTGPRRWVLIRIEDTGRGIAPEDLDRIFVPFYTTKSHGTGLGLAISQRIVENAGGRLEVSSRVGEGTIFTLRLPSQRVSASAEQPDLGGHAPAPSTLQ